MAVGLASSQKKSSQLIERLFPVRAETLLALAITFGMFTAGFEKSTNWIDFDMSESGFLKWFYGGYLNNGRTHMLADWVPHMHPLIIESFDYIAVIFELSHYSYCCLEDLSTGDYCSRLLACSTSGTWCF